VTAVSCVVCTYSADRRDQLHEAVESLRRQTVAPLEIVVVVDHEPRLLRDLCRSLPDAAVRESLGAPGLSGSRNEGLAACRGELVAFLDDDAVAAPDWLAGLLRHLAEPAVMGAGGHAALRWDSGRPAWFPREFDWVVGGSYLGQPEAAADVRNVLGSNMAFRAALVREVGGFREDVGRVGTRPAGCEETELCIRLRQRWPEGRIVYDPEARIVHRVPAARATVRYYLARCAAEGVSKARVAGLVGGRDATASERRHAARTLPAGIVREVAHGVRHCSPGGLLRAAAIVVGLATVAGGFLAERAWRRVVPSR
jgi:GT2 family glycosyltransferase